MEILTKGKSKQSAINKKNVVKKIKKSKEGDKGITEALIWYFILKDKTIDENVIKYIDLYIKQGGRSSISSLVTFFRDGLHEDGFHIEKSEELQFKYFLYANDSLNFHELLDLAKSSPERQRKLVSFAKKGTLHFVYSDIIKDLSKNISDELKIFKYVCILNQINLFFRDEQLSKVVKLRDLNAGERMTHYTNIEAIHSMLRLPEDLKVIDSYKKIYPVLRLYNAAYMNDPEEGLYLFDSENLTEIRSYIEEERYYQTYLASFTTHKIDDLTMWRLYGRDGTGISIVLPAKDYKMAIESAFSLIMNADPSNIAHDEARKQDINLYKVSYECTDIQEKIKTKLFDLKETIRDNEDTENNGLEKYLYSYFAKCSDEIRYLYKNPQYKIEKEFRFLAFHKLESESVKLDERKIPHLYINSRPILFREGSEIIIGPKAENPIALKLDIEYRLKRYGFDNVKVSISNARYK